MSVPIAETYVEIRPKLSPDFDAKLASDVRRSTAVAEKNISGLKGTIGELQGLSSTARGPAKVQIDKHIADLTNELNSATVAANTFAASEKEVAKGAATQTKEVAKAGKEHKLLTAHYSRAHIAGISLRSSYIGVGAAAVVLAQGAHAAAEALRVEGEEAESMSGRLRNATADVLQFNVAQAAAGLGSAAALQFQGGAREAQAAAQESKKREDALNNAIDLAGEYLRIREETAKAEGTLGTAEGANKATLEAQLRALQAQVDRLPEGLNKLAFAQFQLGPGGSTNAAIAGRQAPTAGQIDQNFDLERARAAQSKTSADDLALLKERKAYLQTTISLAESGAQDTEAAKANLISLYGKLDQAEDAINTIKKEALARSQARLRAQIALAEVDIQIGQANARGQAQENSAIRASVDLETKLANDKRLTVGERKQHELSAAQGNQQLFQIQQAAAAEAKRQREEELRIAEQEREEAEAKLARQKDAAKSLRELRLSNALAKAELTTSTADDKKAVQAQIRYWKDIVKSTTGLEREQARSELISSRSRLKGLKSQGGSATTGEFFAQALSDFRSFGSNFSADAGGLSPQSARGKFAALSLGNASAKNVEKALAEERTRNSRALLAEAKKQTALLGTVAGAVGGRPGKGDKVGGPKVPAGSMDSAVLGAALLHGA